MPKPVKTVSAADDKDYVAEAAESSDDLSDDADAGDPLLQHRKKRPRVAEPPERPPPEKPAAAKDAKRVSEERDECGGRERDRPAELARAGSGPARALIRRLRSGRLETGTA